MSFMIWPLGPDHQAVCWTLYGKPTKKGLVPEIATKGSAAVRIDLTELAPHLPSDLRRKWAAVIRDALDLHLVLATAGEAGKAHMVKLRTVAVDAIQILEGGAA